MTVPHAQIEAIQSALNAGNNNQETAELVLSPGQREFVISNGIEQQPIHLRGIVRTPTTHNLVAVFGLEPAPDKIYIEKGGALAHFVLITRDADNTMTVETLRHMDNRFFPTGNKRNYQEVVY